VTVLRTYRVHVDPRRVGDYESFERSEGVPMVRSMDGCIAAGFGKVQGSNNTYLFFSLWRSGDDLQTARATPTWKQVEGKLAKLGVTDAGDVAEDIHLSALSGISLPK
jgi:quinol monooxygenase YgiN